MNNEMDYKKEIIKILEDEAVLLDEGYGTTGITEDEHEKIAERIVKLFTIPNVISRVTFIGEVPKNRFYQVLEKIDAMKRMGYVFSKHERKDSDGCVQFDYELELHGL